MKNNIHIEDQDLRELLSNPKIGGYNKSHYISDCPFCGKPKHFYINRKTYLFDCKKCQAAGNIFKLLLQLGRTDLSLKSSLDLGKSLTKITNLENELLENDLEEEPTLHLPLFFKRVYSSKYLSGRGFNKQDFDYYYVGKSKSRKYRGYVLFIVQEDQECKGIVGRAYMDFCTRRYRNTDKTKFGNLLYGVDELDSSTNTVILVEGIFDKVKLDRVLRLQKQKEIVALATFGKKVSNTQIIKILSKAPNLDKLIYFYDPDAIKEMKNYSLRFCNHFADVEVACLNNPEMDIDDSSKRQIYTALENSMTPTEFFYEKISFIKH